MSRGSSAVALASVLLTATQCTPARDDESRALTGQRIEVLGVWSGVEQRRFEAVLSRFEARSGAVVRYTSAREDGVPVRLAERLSRGRPPDVAMLPQPGLLRGLAESGSLVRPGRDVVADVRRNYSRVWRRLGSSGGSLYGVWFKAANKSLVWYDVAAFEEAGVVPPDDLQGLGSVSKALADSGVVPFAVSARDGWTLTDWFEDVYLKTAGPRRYDRLAAHRMPWTHASVQDALRTMLTIIAPSNVAGGVSGALRTTFERSVELTFSGRPAAAMVHGADFVAGVISSRTPAEVGVDVDVFAFPGRGGPVTTVVGGGDAAVVLRASPAAEELMRYLASPEAAAVWAGRGGFVSPNLNLDLAVYPDELTRGVARSLLDAGEGFRFDLSDLQPSDFGGRDDTGMQRELRALLTHGDVERASRRLERAAVIAYGPGRAAVGGPVVSRGR